MKNHELTQRIIKTISDYSFRSNATVYVSEFSLYLSPLVVKDIEKNYFTFARLKQHANKRQDFFIANDLNITVFCKGVFRSIQKELRFFSSESFFETIIEFKRRVENGNYRGFPQKDTSEDTLRSALCIYIDGETFCEARSSSGQNDIAIPAERTIIETKLWKGQEYYNAGFPELSDYLEKANYTEGYYVVFDYNKTPNDIIKENGEYFECDYQGKKIHVVFVLMNRESPSRLYRAKKRARKNDVSAG